jgi:hypothetical protein
MVSRIIFFGGSDFPPPRAAVRAGAMFFWAFVLSYNEKRKFNNSKQISAPTSTPALPRAAHI